MIVIDASVLLPALVDLDPPGVLVRSRIAGESLGAPELIDLEIASGLRGLERAGLIPANLAATRLAVMGPFPLERFPHRPFLSRIWDLRHNLSVYDASYVALAEVLRVPLVTSDQAIADAPGIACEVELFPDT